MSSPTPEWLLAIQDRYEAFPEGQEDVRDLLAEVEWLRGSLADMLEISREMQANERASVTLAYLQEEIVDILHPFPWESA